MNEKKYIATHVLKQNFVIQKEEKYKKGTLVVVPKRHQKHKGFCYKVVFLNKNGTIKTNRWGALAIFSLDFFKSRKDWFEKI